MTNENFLIDPSSTRDSSYHLYSEITTIETPIYATKKIPTIGADTAVYLYDTILEVRKEELTRVNGRYNTLFETEYSVDLDKGQFYMSPSSIGKTYEFVFFTHGESNPYHLSSDINIYIRKILAWTETRICDGMYFFRYASDEDYMWRVRGGSILYNSRLYIYPDSMFDVRYVSPPTVQNKFRCYQFFVNEDLISSYVDTKTKTLTTLGVLPSSGIYNSMNEAKTDVISRYTSLYESESLDIAFMYINILNGDYRYWIEYPTEGRTIV